MGTADAAVECEASATLCGPLDSTVEEATIMVMMGMRFLKEKEHCRGK